MIYLHICSSLKDDPQRAVAVKCDTKHYSFYPSGPHKNWHCNVFHRLMPRMSWGWLTGLSSLNLFLINMHSHSHDLCDGHRVVTHASQRCSVCSSERERERGSKVKGHAIKWMHLSHFRFMFQSNFSDPYYDKWSRFGWIVWGHSVTLDVMERPYLGHRAR